MAKFDVEGLDELVESLKKMGELTGETAEKMLIAGAEEAKKAWKQAAETFHIKDSEEMIESIGFKNTKTISDVRTLDVYPQGKDSKGVRNAEKAFILHYGLKGSTSKNAVRKRLKKDKRPGPGIPATHWVDVAEESAGPLVLEAMTKVWEEHLRG